MAACTVLTVLHTCRPGCLVATCETSGKCPFQYSNGSSRLYVQHANQQWLSSCYGHEAAVPDHPWLSSDMATWSLSLHTACAIRQLCRIWKPCFGGGCNTVKPPANQQTNKEPKKSNNKPQTKTTPSVSETRGFPTVAQGYRWYIFCAIQLLIHLKNTLCTRYHNFMFCILFSPKTL